MRNFLMGLAVAFLSVAATARPFGFVAYGDTAYMLPRDTSRFEGLIDSINAEQPAFAIHVGDFKGYSSCSDDAYRAQKRMFGRHGHPVILTPGDNDWTDCSVASAGSFDPLERLGALRRMFFGTAGSLGQHAIPLTRQSAAYPENALWVHKGVVFATINAPGPHNNFVMDKALASEAIDRSRADEQWLRHAFTVAREQHLRALVIAFQVDAWTTAAPTYEEGPLDWLRRTIGEEAAKFEGQVLIVQGDSHRLIVDTPYRRANVDAGTTVGLNITRLQVPGWPDHRAVFVEVDTSRAYPFAFRPIVPENERYGAKP
jgi:hypothetical protein